MIKNIIIIVLGYFVWLAYFDEAHSASQENQYCDIKTTIVKTVDKDDVPRNTNGMAHTITTNINLGPVRKFLCDSIIVAILLNNI